MYRKQLQSRKKRVQKLVTQAPDFSATFVNMPMEPNFLDSLIIDYNPKEFPEINFGQAACVRTQWDQRFAS